MPIRYSALLRRTMISYLIVAICMASLVTAHVHLSETHTGANLHSHATEVHFTHFQSGHDSIDGEVLHTTDATAVDINSEVGSIGVCKILQVVALAATMLFLLVVPLRTQYRFSPHTKPHRSHPHYSPLQARAPPR